MRLIESVLTFLVPTLRIPPRWKVLWDQQEVPAFILGARIFLGLFAVIYFLHYFFVDLPLKKEPIVLWAFYRFSCGGAALAAIACSFSKRLQSSILLRVPLALTGLYFGFMQAESMIWRAQIPYAYAIIVPSFAAIVLRTSVFSTCLYLVTAFVLQYRGWISRPEEIPYLLSAAMVAVLAVAIFRSRMTSDVTAFLADQNQLETQKRVIEKEIELNEQIRAFLPKVIYERFDRKIKVERKTVVQAIDDVLRGRRMLVACLHSDIRNFTPRSKTVGPFIQESVVPNMRTCTDIVEAHDGVPRLIGDLVFAYFDVTPPHESLRRAVQCAVEIVDKNRELNAKVPEAERISRHVILSFGEAFVGNTGGSEGSREITAIGRPANLLARVDALTKEPQVQKQLDESSIILTEGATKVLFELSRGFKLEVIELEGLGLFVRDFPEEKRLYLLPLVQNNLRLLSQESNLGDEDVPFRVSA